MSALKVIKNIVMFLAVAFIANLIMSKARAQQTPHEVAQSMSGLSQGALDSISTGDPANAVPQYNTNNTNEALYGGGDLLPTGPGSTKITGCQVNPADPNLYTRQDCEGVNFVMKNRTVRPDMTVSNKDPLIAGNRTITNDPRETLEKYKWLVPVNADGSFGSIGTNACEPTTIVVPPQFEERVCTFYKGSENFLCKAALKVTVDPQYNYQCSDASFVNESQSCNKTLHLSCNQYQECGGGSIVSGYTDTNGLFPYFGGPTAQRTLPNGNIEATWEFRSQSTLTGANAYSSDVVINFMVPDYAQLGTFMIKQTNFVEFFYGTQGWKEVNSAYTNWRTSCMVLASIGNFIWNPPGVNGCPIYDNSTIHTLNLDLKPYIRPGNNTIHFTNGSLGNGDATFPHGSQTPRKLVIEYTPGCRVKLNCTDNWQNGCTELEQRAQ